MELPQLRQHRTPETESARHDQAGPPGMRIEPLTGRTGLKVAGEIDLSARDDWDTVLDSMVDTPSDVYLDLSELEFIDTSATGALVRTASRLGAGRRLVLDRPPVILVRLLHLFWPEAIPTIEVQAR